MCIVDHFAPKLHTFLHISNTCLQRIYPACRARFFPPPLLLRLVDAGKATACGAIMLDRSVRVASMSGVGQANPTEPKSMETPHYLYWIVVIFVVSEKCKERRPYSRKVLRRKPDI